jgi:hypothetical protein
MNEQQNVCLPEDGLQWRVWIVPHFRDDESLVVCKMHHVMGDGLAILILIAGLQEQYSPSQWI